MMAVMPGGFDQHATEMRIARFGDAAAGACRAAGVFGGDEAGKGHDPRGRGKGGGVRVSGGGGGRGGGPPPPRKHRRRSTRVRSGSIVSRSRSSVSTAWR